ncbi:hypothetical protein B7P43_G15555 [Cryptotermes secundus]|uniref:Mos1 transposase HTH domain-containing protein n=1 Tax=Cryptotermes secundus TaxID=105785 RepID=A0A2J7Q434_9NEOP|nr:hypothetical protein B7P43_G15555 [Cryptotermes secundus]
MADQKEQRVCVKFCFLLGKSAAETVGMLQQAFNDDALGKSQVYEWFSRFKSGNMSTEDMPRPGRPSTGRNDENIAKIKRAIDEDRRKTIDQLSEETNISWSTVQRILTEGLHMRRVSAKFVPRLLGDDQRENRVNVCRDLKSEVQNDPEFLKRIVTGNESWCYGYDIESKQSSSQWKTPTSPRPKKARQVRSSVKRMLICFFDVNVIVHKKFHGKFVSSESWSMVFRRSSSIARLILAMFSSFLPVEGRPGRGMSSVDMLPDLKRENHS